MIKHQKSRGFSLIELMVVVGVIGILMVITIPTFSALQRRARLNSTTEEFAQVVRSRRERAISTGRTYVFDFNIANNTYRILSPFDTLTFNITGTVGGHTYIGRGTATGMPPEGFNIGPAVDFPPNDELEMDFRGGATRGVLYLTNDRDTYAIGVGSLGKVRVYRFAAGTWQ